MLEQIHEVRNRGIKQVNFLSANIGGYSQIRKLRIICENLGIRMRNSDVRVQDFKNWIPMGNIIKVGVESFDENTRRKIGKPASDEKLLDFYVQAARQVSIIHSYLIYGLPGDDYDRWFEWIKKLGNLRRQFPRESCGNLRFEFSITNFEPCLGTPLAKAPMVNFKEKGKFLQDWVKVLHSEGFSKTDQLTYQNAKGRLGRMEDSYRMLMKVKRGGSEILEPLSKIFPKGIGRSVPSEKAKRFLDFC